MLSQRSCESGHQATSRCRQRVVVRGFREQLLLLQECPGRCCRDVRSCTSFLRNGVVEKVSVSFSLGAGTPKEKPAGAGNLAASSITTEQLNKISLSGP